MKVFLSALLSFFLAALPLDLDYACMEKGATLYERDGSAYREIATLPPSYFVAVLDSCDDGYCLVSYLDINGYMREDDIKRVDFVPKVKYASASFTVTNDSQPANLRSRAVHGADNIVAVMPSGASGTIIGFTEGTELISGAGKRWYYVRYESSDGFTYGYVYGAHVSAEPFGTNSGERESAPKDPADQVQEPSKSELSFPATVVIIVALCLPLLVVLFMLKPKTREEDAPKA